MTKELEDKIAKRQEANREIIKMLSEAVENNPHQRFWQLLYNFKVVNGYFDDHSNLIINDDYNKESVDILKDLQKI